MITYIDILNDEKVKEEYKKIDKQNKYPFNHGLVHVKNVCDIMTKLCVSLGISGEEKDALLIASALHDIGQVNGRENHGLKAREYIINNYSEELKKCHYYNQILDAVRDHDQKTELDTLPLFTNLVCFADKMDFTYRRLETNYKDIFGYLVYEDVIDVEFEYDGNSFILGIKTNEILNAKELLLERKFFHKVIDATIAITKKIKVLPVIKVNNVIIDM